MERAAIETQFAPGWAIGLLFAILAGVFIWHALFGDHEYIEPDIEFNDEDWDDEDWDEDEDEDWDEPDVDAAAWTGEHRRLRPDHELRVTGGLVWCLNCGATSDG